MFKCTVVNCDSIKHKAKGLCTYHYGRHLAGLPLDVPKRRYSPKSKCTVEGCDNAHRANGFCYMHNARVKKYGTTDRETSSGRQYGDGKRWHKSPHGYIVRFEPTNPQAGPNGQVYQHRHVMAGHLERPLKSHENVHHINGNRADNRIDNLELWTSWQPAGQRVSDLLDYARAIIAEYGD